MSNPWQGVAETLAGELLADGHRGVVAISGGQGAGKSTLAAALASALSDQHLRVAACSLDDFYLTAAERRTLAELRHPLFATRGVPGTHDVELCGMTLDALLAPGETAVPVFDKGTDDRAPQTAWRRLRGPMDIVIFEGWCLGARPQREADLEVPANDLERLEDPDGAWRRAVNDALAGPYADLFARFAFLIYLKVPDLGAVRRWRGDQEVGLPEGRRMSDAALTRFIQHYERLTRWMREDVPKIADLTLVLGEDHAVLGRQS